MKDLKYMAVMAIALLIGVAATSAFGQETVVKEKTKAEYKDKQRSFCDSSNNWSNDDKVSFRDLRETTISATGSLTADGGQNGGISVIGSERNDIVVRACVQTWGETDAAAKAAAANIRINTSGTIKAEGSGEKNWSVSFQLLVPRATDLNLSARNGGISVSGTDGRADFETVNGGLHLKNISGAVKGRTTNGGVHVVLSGNTWRGSGLDLTTTNGGVHLTMPDGYAAHIETGTVNGGFHSNIDALKVEKGEGQDRHRATKISTDINGGGPPIKVITTNGGVHINAGESERQIKF